MAEGDPITATASAAAGEAAPIARAAPSPAPAEPTPIAAPAEPAVTAISEPAAPSSAPAEPAAPERPETLLTRFDKEQAKPADKAPAEAAKPADAAKPGEVAKATEPEPLSFTLPPEFKAEPKQLEDFTGLIRDAAKANPKETGEKLLAMHAEAMQHYATELAANQWQVFRDMIAAKDKEVLADPTLGGAGHNTAMAAVVRGRDLLVPEGKQKEFTDFLETTGAGSWPIFLHLLHRAAEIFDEPAPPAPNGRPPRDAHVPSASGGRFAILHDHPTSQINGRA